MAAWAGLAGLTGTRSIRAVISQPDAQTPLEVDKLEIDTVSSGAGKQIHREKCRDCVDLGTEIVAGTGTADDSSSLRAEARLLTVGAGAMAGMMWLAVLSG